MMRRLGALVGMGIFLAGCATTDPCRRILEEKPLNPGVRMNTVKIVDSSLHSELVGVTYCEGQRITASEQPPQEAEFIKYKITVEKTGTRRTPTGTLEVWTLLKNHTNFPLQVEGRTRFFDQSQAPTEGPSPWKRIHLPPKGVGTYRTFSTQTEAVDFYYIEIREGR